MAQLYDAIGIGYIEIRPLLVPHDCTDGFLGVYWRRQYAYLDPDVHSAISTFAKVSDMASGLARLRGDLADGTWEHRYGYLLRQSELDLGYRLVIAYHGRAGTPPHAHAPGHIPLEHL